MYTSVYLKRIPGSPHSSDSLPPPVPWALLVPMFGSSTSWGKDRFAVGSAVTCWAISTELLGPRRSSFSGEGKARKVEMSAGDGEDSTGAGSYGTGGTGGTVKV